MEQFQPDEDGNDPMLEDFTVFRGVAPYLSFSDPNCTGYERGGTILAVGTDFARKFKTNEPEFWTYGPKKGQQRMCRVLIIQTQERIPGRTDDTGIRTLELKDGKDIFRAAALAVRTAGGKNAFEPGGQIYITRTGKRPSQGGQDAVTFTARYIPPPADYQASDANLMAQNLMDQGNGQPPAQPQAAPQQVQQAAAYVASTPAQPQYMATPNGAPQQAPWQGQQPQQQAPAAQGQAPWMQQGPAQQAPWAGQQQPQAAPQQPQQAPPWQAQQPQAQPTNGHPFGPSTQQPMASPYPPQQQG
jgi:hypothetical protein